jgi:hypothetical protein
MTIDAFPRKSRRSRPPRESAPLAIGVADAQIFDCPACRRPLAVGVSRCPSCRTRLFGGIRATKAAGFVATGLMVGLIIGTGGTAAVLTLARPVPAPIVIPMPVMVPLPSVAPVLTAAPVVDPAPPTISGGARSALHQSTLIDARLVADADRLGAALTSKASTADLARILRSMAADAAVGERLAAELAGWSDGAIVAAGLTEAYAAVGATAASGTHASLSNTRAYQEASRDMLAVVDGITTLDADVRALAATVGVELPVSEERPAP